MKTRRRKPKPKKFGKEAELCEYFMRAMKAQGWIVYPETGNFDVMLLATDRTLLVQEHARFALRSAFHKGWVKPGDLVGVEAKLRGNTEVIHQAARSEYEGPDFRSVLVPKAGRSFEWVAMRLGLGVITAEDLDPPVFYSSAIGKRVVSAIEVARGSRWTPTKRPWIPPVVPEGPAGEPSPRTLTRWRVKALRLCIVLEDRGYLMTEDFAREKVNIGRWRDLQWLTRGENRGRFATYVRGPGKNFPSEGWEVEMSKLRKKLS